MLEVQVLIKNSFLAVSTALAEFTWTQEKLDKFVCRRDDAWQLPESCGSECTESDKEPGS